MLDAGAFCLADTNILIRLAQREDPSYGIIRDALRSLRRARASVCFTSQNMAEFWNVCTRPNSQNGYGLTIAETDRRASLIESVFTFLPDSTQVHAIWRRLVVDNSVVGVEVHDARLVAAMRAHGVAHILSLDERDFARYSGIIAVHPREFTALP